MTVNEQVQAASAAFTCLGIGLSGYALWRFSRVFPHIHFIRLIQTGIFILLVRWSWFLITVFPGGPSPNDLDQLVFRSLLTALGWMILASGFLRMARKVEEGQPKKRRKS